MDMSGFNLIKIRLSNKYYSLVTWIKDACSGDFFLLLLLRCDLRGYYLKVNFHVNWLIHFKPAVPTVLVVRNPIKQGSTTRISHLLQFEPVLTGMSRKMCWF